MTKLLGLAAAMMVAMIGSVDARPAYVPSTLNLRAAAGTNNEIVAKIPAGSLVDVDTCSDGWCAVKFQDVSGFAIETGLDLSGRVPPRRAVGVMPPPPPPPPGDVVVVGPPAAVYYGPRRYWYGGPNPRYWGYPRYRW